MISNEKVVARWARGDPDRWPSGASRNVFFEGPTLYSWGHHFPLARWTTDARGRRCVLANLSEKRSMSTSRHQSLVRCAPYDPGVPIHNVPDVMAEDRDDHMANRAAWLAQLDQDLVALTRARALWRRAWLMDHIDHLVDNVRTYSSAFNLGRVTNPLPAQTFDVGEVVTAVDQYAVVKTQRLAVVERCLGGRRWLVRSPVDGEAWDVHEVSLTRSK